MNTLTNPNVNFVMDSLKKYIENLYKTQQINLQEMVNFMEPVFHKAGYRTLRGGSAFS